jgi:hypothetical protein
VVQKLGLVTVIGDLPFAQVNNKSCKPLVEAMFNAELSICSVNNCLRRRKELRCVAGIYAVDGWISGSMITAFTAFADSVSRIWKRCERTDI